MELLPNEQIIKRSADNEFTLTNFRVVNKYNWWFNTFSNSISLEDISSLERYDRNFVLLLILGILAIIFGLFGTSMGGGSAIGIGGFILGIILILLWWFTRKTAVRITPNGGKSIVFHISKASSNAEDIIFNIQLAKINRIQQLYNSKF